jgi:hypothetical protein
MTETTTSQPYSNNYWKNSSKFISKSKFKKEKKQNEEESLNRYLSSIDDSPEFYDPYSDLNLFLSKKIKKEMQNCACSKKWSYQLQEELLEKITPEFKAKFPQLRLGVCALKKRWEKITYYTHQIEGQREALNSDGTLNLSFFIKENLKNYLLLDDNSNLHPSYYAHQLATQLSECQASVDGIRSNLEHLTQMIWSIQRHLLRGPLQKSPYDHYDETDQLIVKTIVEITATHPLITHSELKLRVKEAMTISMDQKIERWTLQGEMLYRFIHLNSEDTLLELICKKRKGASHALFVSEICQEYLAAYPELTPYTAQLSARVWILYKYAWYTSFATAEESSFDRFVKWHAHCYPDLSLEELICKLETIVTQTLPLVPFERKQIISILGEKRKAIAQEQ